MRPEQYNVNVKSFEDFDRLTNYLVDKYKVNRNSTRDVIMFLNKLSKVYNANKNASFDKLSLEFAKAWT